MIVGTVLLCPPLGRVEPYHRTAVARLVRGAGSDVVAPDAAPGVPWVAGLALSLAAMDVRGPLLLVLAGGAGRLAPQLGLSQRAARRTVAGYVLLDTEPPLADSDGPEWPDAPVAYLASAHAPAGALAHGRLRAWRTVELADRAAPTIADALMELSRD